MLSDIRLQRFRSYRDERFGFDTGVNIIVGPNASGKTNLLEALLVICRGVSFRAKDREMVAFGAPWARLDAQTDDGTRTVKFMFQETGTLKKEFVIHDQKLSRLSLQRSLPSVLFEPNHLQLLHGSPEHRREFLDNLLEQTTPGYGKLYRDYRRTLAQRNALLKQGHSHKKQLFVWNVRLSELGAQLAGERYALTIRLDNQLAGLYESLADQRGPEVTMQYQASCEIGQYGTNLLHALERRQDRDIERGFTSVGPHREDVLVCFGGRNAAEVASRGETRTILLALKLMELQLVEAVRGRPPVLLLDDVFSELDGGRRQALTEVISKYQSFITTTDADLVAHHFTDKCRIIPLQSKQ